MSDPIEAAMKAYDESNVQEKHGDPHKHAIIAAIDAYHAAAPSDELENLDAFGWQKIQAEWSKNCNAAYHLGLRDGRAEIEQAAQLANDGSVN